MFFILNWVMSLFFFPPMLQTWHVTSILIKKSEQQLLTRSAKNLWIVFTTHKATSMSVLWMRFKKVLRIPYMDRHLNPEHPRTHMARLSALHNMLCWPHKMALPVSSLRSLRFITSHMCLIIIWWCFTQSAILRTTALWLFPLLFRT